MYLGPARRKLICQEKNESQKGGGGMIKMHNIYPWKTMEKSKNFRWEKINLKLGPGQIFQFKVLFFPWYFSPHIYKNADQDPSAQKLRSRNIVYLTKYLLS